LISYASNIVSPDTQFLDMLKDKIKKRNDNSKKPMRSILLLGTHSGDDELSEGEIDDLDKGLLKVVEHSGVDHMRSSLNENYEYLVPVDNKMQGIVYGNSELQVTGVDTKRYTNPSRIREYIHEYILEQDVIPVPIKWLLLELEIRKVCQEKNAILFHIVMF